MNKEIDFLKELQKELKTQNHDSQASPRFWTVADYEDRVVGDGYHDKVEIYSPDSCTSQSLVEAIEELKEYGKSSLYELDRDSLRVIELYEDGENDILELYQEYIDKDAYMVYLEKTHIIKPNTMFLTKQEAKDHIRLNNYHYTSEAHTYAMTAWRSPKVEKVLDILENFDWDKMEMGGRR